MVEPAMASPAAALTAAVMVGCEVALALAQRRRPEGLAAALLHPMAGPAVVVVAVLSRFDRVATPPRVA